MTERLEAILPQVPVEGIAVHIGRAGIWMVRRRLMGISPVRRMSYLGHLGPVAERILAPALIEGLMLRLRIVVLTPEHLATSGPPEIHVSVWADPYRLAPCLSDDALILPEPLRDADRDEDALSPARGPARERSSSTGSTAQGS